MKKNNLKKHIILSAAMIFMLISWLTASTAYADPYDWYTPWRDGEMVVTQDPTNAGHQTAGDVWAIDFAPRPRGNPALYSPTNARIDFIGYAKGSSTATNYGHYMILVTNDGKEKIRYAHMNSIAPGLNNDREVDENTLLGYTGQSGGEQVGMGIHLHMELMNRTGSERLKPIPLFGLPSERFLLNNMIPVRKPGSTPPPQEPPVPPQPPVKNGIVEFYDAEAGRTNDKWNYDLQGPRNAQRAEDMGFRNDELSNLCIQEDNLVVELFSDGEYRGKSIKFENKGQYDLRNYDFNNITSCYKVYWKGQEITGLVGFYDAEAGHTGDKWNYYRGIGNAKTADMMGFPNDQLSSVEIFDENVSVELFLDSNYSGGESLILRGRKKFDLRSVNGRSFNNSTSSYKVYYTAQGPVPDLEERPVPEPHEVRNVSIDTAGNLAITLIKSANGQQVSVPRIDKISNGDGYIHEYGVKFPDNTRFYIDPSYKINALHSDQYFATGDGKINNAGAWEVFPGGTVHFGEQSTTEYSCTLWVQVKAYPAPPTDDSKTYEVQGFSVNASAGLEFSIVNNLNGQTSSVSPHWERGYSDSAISQYMVKFKNNTAFYLDPSYKIVALHTDRSFASGGGRTNDAGVFEFFPGETAVFGEHDESEFSCTIWVQTDGYVTPPPITPSYEVRGFSLDAGGYPRFDIVNKTTGEGASFSWEKGSESTDYFGQYFIKFPDNTDFYISPSYEIAALHTDPAFAAGSDRTNSVGGLEFLPGETVHFAQHGQSEVSCTLWIRVKEHPYENLASYEVNSFSADSFGNLNIEVIDTVTGQKVTPLVEKGNEGNQYYAQYFVQFPDHTNFKLDPAYNIVALHSDPSFASGGGRIKEATDILEFYPGETVYFAAHGQSDHSCTIWVRLNDPQPPSDLPIVLNIEILPTENYIEKGKSLQLHSNVEANGGADATVKWSLSPNSSSSISKTGQLTVGVNETADVLTVKAQSTFDSKKYSVTKINVISSSDGYNGDDDNNGGSNDSGGGGCDTGLGLSGVILVLASAITRRRKY